MLSQSFNCVSCRRGFFSKPIYELYENHFSYLISWQRVAHAILGSRILLHIRKANEIKTTVENPSAIVFRRPSTRVESQSRSFIERAGDEIEEWLAPDPQLYPSMRLVNPPATVVSEVEAERQPSEGQGLPVD